MFKLFVCDEIYQTVCHQINETVAIAEFMVNIFLFLLLGTF